MDISFSASFLPILSREFFPQPQAIFRPFHILIER